MMSAQALMASVVNLRELLHSITIDLARPQKVHARARIFVWINSQSVV